MEKQILKIKEIYEKFLKITEITNLCEKEYKKKFNLKIEGYGNPFRVRYDFEKVVKEVKGSVINQIIILFNEKYPNIDLDNTDLEKFIITELNKYGYKEQGDKIYFEKIIKYLQGLESKKELLSLQHLLNNSIKLIPNNLIFESYRLPRKFRAEEIIRGKKLILYCYNENSTPELKDFLKLINVILKRVNPVKAEEYNCYVKHYKNHRLDIKLNEKDCLKVSKFLEVEITKRFMEWTKQKILNKLE